MKLNYNGSVEELKESLVDAGYIVDITEDEFKVASSYNIKQYLKEHKIKIRDIMKGTGIVRNTILEAIKISDRCMVRKIERVLEYIGLKLQYSPQSIKEAYSGSGDISAWSTKSGLSEGTVSRIILDHTGCKMSTLKQLMKVLGITITVIKR